MGGSFTRAESTIGSEGVGRGHDPQGICNELALLDAKHIATKFGIGIRTFWRWVSTGTFPSADLRMGAKIVRWRCGTVVNWFKNQPTLKNGGNE